MRVLLLSAYAAQSHVYWRTALQTMFPHWQWQVLELPPRYFGWRVRGNPLYWGIDQRAVLEAEYDLLLATSMVDLATLRGLLPSLAQLPTALYFHENQFAYPQTAQQHSSVEAQMVSLYSALAADCLLFNSAYNRETFFRGLAELLARLPDYLPAGIVDGLQQKSRLLPVPVVPGPTQTADPWPVREGKCLRILWSARFEYDKGGERLYAILRQLDELAVDYQLALTGQQFRQSPPVFASIQRDFAHRLLQFGYLEDAAVYRAWQRGADLVLSTALHEFQGLAVMEAVLQGCEPVLPDRLAYRDFFPPRCRYVSDLDDIEAEAAAAAGHIAAIALRGPRPPDISACSFASLREEYAQVLGGLAAAG